MKADAQLHELILLLNSADVIDFHLHFMLK